MTKDKKNRDNIKQYSANPVLPLVEKQDTDVLFIRLPRHLQLIKVSLTITLGIDLPLTGRTAQTKVMMGESKKAVKKKTEPATPRKKCKLMRGMQYYNF